ncbi:MAG: TGS domain-containing protein [Bacillati bacterium ANGP1]|uniref:TGS domain-containing protein n=1 Tax=Candidatus Segetimicrobium genomatis TaxID=2569760 RepID=A0A537J7Y4_9BACT|nr:MAG: TGS domain-containing protein [Terrabacteria group bacterium ANGP1]
MPANLTPQYLDAERRFREATTPEEQLAALNEMMATIPKHKGTEHMRADIRRRMAKVRTEAARKRSSGRGPTWHHVPREGAGQEVLIGPPNAGKSRLLAALSNATPVVAPYPFSTRTPFPGMVPFENVQIQLIDLPPIAPETAEPWLFALIRQADGALLVADLASDDLLSSMEETLTLLERFNVSLGGAGAPSEDGGGAEGRGSSGSAGTSQGPGADGRLDILRELYASRWPILAVSAETGMNIDALRLEMFRLLNVIRVYTKARGRRADLSVPFVLKRGTTVQDAAAVVHKDFADRLKYARIWGTGTFEGQMVQREHVLEDGDILELHA